MRLAADSTLTDSCRQTLERWRGRSADQEELRQQYLGHLSRSPDGWSRDCRPAHLTASSLICAVTEQQVLLTLHARIGRWLQTGGHLEPDDPALTAAALREATEESGLSGLVLHPEPLLLSRHPVSCAGQPAVHLDVQFLVRTPTVVTPVVGAESLDVRWFAVAALPEVDDSVSALVRAAADELGWR